MTNKTLVFDIETLPMEVFVWDTGEQFVRHDQIKKDWSVGAWGAKWLNAPPSKVIYRDTRFQKDPRRDVDILHPMRNLLDEAEVVITQNGKKFDVRKLNARFIELGIRPPSPFLHIDNYREIKKIAAFTSHSLEYLTEKLNKKYKKLKHKKYPGLSLWKECLRKNHDAWDEMKRYNIHDVLSTEELYLNTRAWFPTTVPDVYQSTENKCGTCGKAKIKRGVGRNKNGFYQRYQCQSCGSWSKGEKLK